MTKAKQVDLSKMRIASPCPMSWDKMQGDQRTRHCGECKLNVFNVAELSKEEAEALIAKSLRGERVCVRLLKRADGTIITKDCPVGRRIVVRKRYGISAAVTAIFSFVFGLFIERVSGEELRSEKSNEKIEALTGDLYVPPVENKKAHTREFLGKLQPPKKPAKKGSKK